MLGGRVPFLITLLSLLQAATGSQRRVTTVDCTGRDAVHLGPLLGLAGPPSAFFRDRAGDYHLYFEQTRDFSNEDTGLRDWAHLASHDLVRWRWLGLTLTLDPMALVQDATFGQGAIVTMPDGFAFPYMLLSTRHDCPQPVDLSPPKQPRPDDDDHDRDHDLDDNEQYCTVAIRNTFTHNLSSLEQTSLTSTLLALPDSRDPSAFVFNGGQYLAAAAPERDRTVCNVQLFYLYSDADRVMALPSQLPVRMPTGAPCRHLHVFQVDGQWFFLFSLTFEQENLAASYYLAVNLSTTAGSTPVAHPGLSAVTEADSLVFLNRGFNHAEFVVSNEQPRPRIITFMPSMQQPTAGSNGQWTHTFSVVRDLRWDPEKRRLYQWPAAEILRNCAIRSPQPGVRYTCAGLSALDDEGIRGDEPSCEQPAGATPTAEPAEPAEPTSGTTSPGTTSPGAEPPSGTTAQGTMSPGTDPTMPLAPSPPAPETFFLPETEEVKFLPWAASLPDTSLPSTGTKSPGAAGTKTASPRTTSPGTSSPWGTTSPGTSSPRTSGTSSPSSREDDSSQYCLLESAWDDLEHVHAYFIELALCSEVAFSGSSFVITLSNAQDERLKLSFNHIRANRPAEMLWHLDLTHTVEPAFNYSSYRRDIDVPPSGKVAILLDLSIIEVFAESGLFVIAAAYEASSKMNHLCVTSRDNVTVGGLKVTPLASIWDDSYEVSSDGSYNWPPPLRLLALAILAAVLIAV